MPTYEYQCDACGHQFEKFQSITAPAIRKCPKCGKSRVKRLVSAGAGIIFKGSGFYITDYRDSKYQESAKADTADGGKKADSTSTESKGDAKPNAPAAEAKGDAKPSAEKKPETKSEPKRETKSSRKKK